MSVTLHYNPISQPSRAVLALLKIGGIEFEPKVIDLMKQEQKTPEYLAINEFGSVPCLTHGELSLGESNAILTYLCEAFPNELQQYKGITLDERSKVNEYLSWYQGSWRPTVLKKLRLLLGSVFRKVPVKGSDLNEAEKGMCTIFDFLEKRLTKRPYICGDKLTIADILIFHEATNVEMYKFDISSWKNFKAWYERVLENKVINEIHQNFRTNALPRVWGLLSTAIIQHDLKLYTHIISQPCRAVMSLLALGKIQHEQIEVKIFEGQTKKPEYLETNMFGTIPALVHGEEHIGESNAMLTYLCQAFPEKLACYYGSSLLQKTKVDDFLSWYQGTLRPSMLACLIQRFRHNAQKKPIKKALYDEAETKMKGALNKVEGFLSKGNPFLCGPKVTIVDILFFHEICNIILYKFDISSWANLKAWFDRMLEIEEIGDIIKRYKETLPKIEFFNQILAIEIVE